MEIKKDDDIFDKNGKLTIMGAFLIISVLVGALNLAFNYLKDNIVDKENVN